MKTQGWAALTNARRITHAQNAHITCNVQHNKCTIKKNKCVCTYTYAQAQTHTHTQTITAISHYSQLNSL